MNTRKVKFFSACTAMLIILILLVTTSPLLTVSLNTTNTIPLGTFITWLGMICLPLSIYWGIKELRKPSTKLYTYLAYILKTLVVLAMLWVPICYLLSGNLSFTFTEKDTFQGGQLAMKWFWRFSYSIAIGSILVLLIYWISLFFKKKK